MAEGKIFVGRKAELEQFKKVLKNPKGQAVLVVGQTGMGKTWLVNKMAEIAENHPKLKCGWVRYEVTKEDSVDSRLAIMIDDAFEAASNPKKFWGGDDRGKKQWVALYKVLESIPSAGKVFEAIRGLAKSLKRDISKDSRQQFVEKLNLISKKMPSNGRAIFIVDPEKYMRPGSDEAWAIVVKELPEKIKFVFAQRPEDVLVESETFGALDNVSRIPEERLDVLEEESVDELINKRVAGLKYSVTEVREVLSRYEGHPYALQGSLDLLKAGMELEELPESPEPTKFVQVQWSKVCNSSDGSIELFEAYAVLEIGVPDDVVEAVSGIKSSKQRKLLADKYLAGLFRDEGEGRRIYHAILADYIFGQISVDEKNAYHGRAVGVYRGKLAKAKKEKTKPDALAAIRLAKHVLATYGKEAFVYSVVDECGEALMDLGFLDSAKRFLDESLSFIQNGSSERSTIIGNLGILYFKMGEMHWALKVLYDAIQLDKRLGNVKGVARHCMNLGLVYKEIGKLQKADEVLRRSIQIYEKCGDLKNIAFSYRALGEVCQRRGGYNNAEDLLEKALLIDKGVGKLKCVAADYGNLGLNNMLRGDLQKAEEMYKKSLAIHKRLANKEGIAVNFMNLGAVCKQRGDIEMTKGYWEKALGLYNEIGMPHMVKKVEELIRGIGK